MRIILAWSIQRRSENEHAALLAAAQTSLTEINRRKEILIMAGTMADVYFREGAARGIQKSILRQLGKRFGSVPEALVNEINAVMDLPRLEAALDQIPALQQLTDFHL